MRAYFDHATAATPDPRLRAAAERHLGEWFASPSAVHEEARAPAEALETARGEVAALLGAAPEEIIFTAGATEARNLAVKGILAGNRAAGRGAVTTAVEHPATLAAARTATREEGGPRVVGVNRQARVEPDRLAEAVGDDTALVALHHGQPDVGTLQDVAACVAAVRGRSETARIVVDAAATAGLVPCEVASLGADAVVIGGVSLGAPGWSGALWLRPGARCHPLVEGGLQEWGKRGGEPVLPGIAALGAAARLARTERRERAHRAAHAAARLAERVLAVPDVTLNGPVAERVPGYLHLTVPGVEGESLALALSARGVAVAPGSPCSAHAGKESPTLLAMGRAAPDTLSSILFSAGWTTTDREVEIAAAAFADAVERLRALSPLRG